MRNGDYGPDLHPIARSASERPGSMQEATAYASFQGGDIQRAEQICRLLLAVNPRLREVMHLLAIISFHKNEMNEAVHWMHKAVSGFGDPPTLYLLNLGLILNGAGRWDEAIAVMTRACESEPEQLDFNTKLAAVMLNAGRLDEAQARIDKRLQMQPMDMQAMTVAERIRARKLRQPEPTAPTSNVTDYTVTISARNKRGGVCQLLQQQFASLPLQNIDSLFGFHRHCRLYGGRAFQAPEIDDADLKWMYANSIGFRIPLTSKLVTREEYEQERPFLEMHHREGNSVIVVGDALAQWIRRDFPLYQIEASVIREVDTADKLLKALELFDTVVPLPEQFNTNYALLASLPAEVRARLRLFVNAGCMYHCPHRVCYTSFSKMNKQMPDAHFECSQHRFSYFFTQGMTDFPMERYLEMGFRKFKVLRSRGGAGSTGN